MIWIAPSDKDAAAALLLLPFRLDWGEGWGAVSKLFTAQGNANFARAQHFIHEYKSRTLATLRDTLLPKLLNGELSVAEKQ